MKKLKASIAPALLPAFAAIMAVIAIWGYGRAYHIEPDNGNLSEGVNHFLNAGSRQPAPYGIKLYDSVALGGKKFTLAEIDGQLGVIEMQKGLNGRYKISSVGYGGGNFREWIEEYGGKKFLLFGGRNAVWGISGITFSASGMEYAANIPEKERFLIFAELDPFTEETHIDLDTLRFYNASGEDITDSVPWNDYGPGNSGTAVS